MKPLIAALAFGLTASATSAATLEIDISQIGDDVVATVSGAIDLTGMSGGATHSFDNAHVWPALSAFHIGTGQYRDWYSTIDSIDSVGTMGYTFADSWSGDMVGFANLGGGNGLIVVSSSYVSNSPLSSTATWIDTTLGDLGLSVGTFNITAGPTTFTYDVSIGAVPVPASLPLLGSVLVGGALLRRRKRAD